MGTQLHLHHSKQLHRKIVTKYGIKNEMMGRMNRVVEFILVKTEVQDAAAVALSGLQS